MDENKPGLRRTILLTVAVPLLLVLIGMICLAGWANFSEDPDERDPPANFDCNLKIYEPDQFTKVMTLYQRFQATQKSVGDPEKISTLMRYGDDFQQAGSPGQALECYKLAIVLGQHWEHSQHSDAIPLAMADANSSLARCYLLMAKNENAYIAAVNAFKSFQAMGVRNDRLAILNLATLIELCSEVKRLPEGDLYLNALKHSTIAQAPPEVQAILYQRAAKYLQERGDAGTREITWDNRQVPTTEIEQMYLHAALDAWKKLESKHIPEFRGYGPYNEAVIYNRLGLLAEASGDLPSAHNFFQQALKGLKDCEVKGRRVAKVMFNLGDVELRQNKFWDYLQTHNQAKQIWSTSWS